MGDNARTAHVANLNGLLADAFALYEANRAARASKVQRISHDNTWLRTNEDPSWCFGYDVFTEPLVSPSKAAA